MGKIADPLDGCTVEKLDEKPGEICYAYSITCPNGKEYMLMRNRPNPYMLFIIGPNLEPKLKGYSWFCDGDKIFGPGTKPLRAVK